MEKINFSDLSREQQEQLMAQAAAENRKQQEAVKAERDTYKELVHDAVVGNVKYLQEVSAGLSKSKACVFNDFRGLIKMKTELFGLKDKEQRSHTFSSKDGMQRVTLGYYVTDNYDDTVNVGIEKVQAYISALATDERSKQLVSMVNKLMAKDNQGNLKASRVLQLKKHAEESGDAAFIDAVGIIEAAYRPIKSRQFIRAEYKDAESNEWKSVPLGITEAEMAERG